MANEQGDTTGSRCTHAYVWAAHVYGKGDLRLLRQSDVEANRTLTEAVHCSFIVEIARLPQWQAT